MKTIYGRNMNKQIKKPEGNNFLTNSMMSWHRKALHVLQESSLV